MTRMARAHAVPVQNGARRTATDVAGSRKLEFVPLKNHTILFGKPAPGATVARYMLLEFPADVASVGAASAPAVKTDCCCHGLSDSSAGLVGLGHDQYSPEHFSWKGPW